MGEFATGDIVALLAQGGPEMVVLGPVPAAWVHEDRGDAYGAGKLYACAWFDPSGQYQQNHLYASTLRKVRPGKER